MAPSDRHGGRKSEGLSSHPRKEQSTTNVWTAAESRKQRPTVSDCLHLVFTGSPNRTEGPRISQNQTFGGPLCAGHAFFSLFNQLVSEASSGSCHQDSSSTPPGASSVIPANGKAVHRVCSGVAGTPGPRRAGCDVGSCTETVWFRHPCSLLLLPPQVKEGSSPQLPP